MEKKKSKKKNAGSMIYVSIMLLAGILCGGMAGVLLARAEEQGVEFWVGMVALLLGVYDAMLIQIIVHETGHLVFGLVSG